MTKTRLRHWQKWELVIGTAIALLMVLAAVSADWSMVLLGGVALIRAWKHWSYRVRVEKAVEDLLERLPELRRSTSEQ